MDNGDGIGYPVRLTDIMIPLRERSSSSYVKLPKKKTRQQQLIARRRDEARAARHQTRAAWSYEDL